MNDFINKLTIFRILNDKDLLDEYYSKPEFSELFSRFYKDQISLEEFV